MQAFVANRPVLTRRLCPTARWLSPRANRSRSPSRIFRIGNPTPGIPIPRRSAKDWDCVSSSWLLCCRL